MVIELSGEQFCLSSYGCTRFRFETASMISDHNCRTRSSITTLLRPFSITLVSTNIIDPVAGWLKAEPETLLHLTLYAKQKKNAI